MPDKKPPYNTSGPRTSNKESQEEKDAMNAMMKAKLAYEYMHGNLAAKRMVASTDNPYNFGDGYLGTHYMGSYNYEDESGKERYYAIPNIQDVDGTLKMTGPRANEEIEFDRPKDARYFAENYKRVSPAFQKHGGKLNLKEAFEIHNQGGGAGRISLEKFAKLVPKSDWGMTYFEMAEKYGWEQSDKLKKAEAEGKIKSLKNGGSMAPIIPTYYKSKGTPIYRDTTALPFEKGGKTDGVPTFTPEQLAQLRYKALYGATQNLDEITVYGSKEKRSLQDRLYATLQSLKGASNDWYHSKGFDKGRGYDNTKKRFSLKQKRGNDIDTLQENIDQYKKFFKKNKAKYKTAEEALKDLKKYYPDTWKNKKLKDVFSNSGYEAIRSLSKNDKISQDTWKNYYNSFAKDLDPFMAQGKGPNKDYDAAEARRVWGKSEDWKDFTNMVNKLAIPAPLMGGMGAFAPEIAGGISSVGRGLGHAYTSLGQPIIGGTTSTGLYSGLAPSLQWLTPGLALEGYGAYYLADQLGDSNSNMRKSWRNVAKDTNLSTIDQAVGATAFPILGASGTIVNTAGKVIPKIISAGKTIANVPQIRTAGTGIKEVWNKPYRWSELGKQKSVYRFEKPKTASLRSNVKADPTRDVTKGKWYQDKSNPEFNLYSDPKVNPNARRFTGSEAAVKKYNLETIQNKMAAGKKVSKAERVAVERSIGSMSDIKMRNYVNEVRKNFGEGRAKQIEELVKNPNNYWNFKTFKEDPVNRFLLRSAPANKSEYLLPNEFAFDAVRKTSELKNMSPADKFNYFKNIGGEYKVGVSQAEAKIAPKIAEAVAPAGKLSKTSKIAKQAGFESEEENMPAIETNKLSTKIP